MNETTYDAFLSNKRTEAKSVGFPVGDLNPALFPFQREIVRWAIQRGRAAIFADCGLGKSLMELEWLEKVGREIEDRPTLMLTPLGVAKQMTREGAKFGYDVNLCRTGADVKPGINVTNYEKLHHFDSGMFGALCLDESSILKSFEGSTRKALTAFAQAIPYRLAASATPAPNDLIELTNHSEFLEVMTGKEMIAQFFTQDGNTVQKYRLKNHARDPFWAWMASWAVAIRRPSDLGFDDDGFILPELRLHQETLSSENTAGFLFTMEASTLQERRNARRESLPRRAARTAELVASYPDEPWILWVDLNDEADELKRLIPEAVEIRGPETADAKETKIERFSRGDVRVLISKPSICGHGLNWQHCAKMVFVGQSDSHEYTYQAIRRCWRFGQDRPVDVWTVVSEAEGAVIENVRRKERDASEMFDQIVRHMQALSLGRQKRDSAEYRPREPMMIPHWIGATS